MMHEMRRAFFRHGRGRGPREVWGWGFSKEWGGWRAGRIRPMRRGDVKYVVLEVLADGPKHGYEVISAIEERRNVRPSAGSIYPTLQMLEDAGFATSAEVGGKRVYTITGSGRELLANRAGDDDDDDDAAPDARQRLRESAMKLANAVVGVRGADDATADRVREILDRARKEVYTILASDET